MATDQPGNVTPARAGAEARLDRSLVTGIAWTALFRWAAQLVSWVISLYVARVLTPGDFGLVAMAMVAIGLARMVEDLGLDVVIVQDRTLTDLEISRLGGLAVLVGLGLCALYSALAWPLARFYGEPQLLLVTCLLSATFITDALQIVPRALLQRDLAFRRLAAINAAQLLVQSLTLAACAVAGLGLWSLVWNTIVAAIVVTVILNFARPHTLAWPRELRRLTRSIRFGVQMLLSRIAAYGCTNADSAIGGKVLGRAALGAYQWALDLAAKPLQEVTALVSKVVPGIFSTVQHDRPALRRYYLSITEALAFLTLPMSFGIALVADDLVRAALGEQWLNSIAPLRALACYFGMISISMLLAHVLIWTGRAAANLLLQLLALVVTPICVYAGSRYGLAGIGWSLVVAFPLSTLPAYVIVFRMLDISAADFLRAVGPAVRACLVMTAGVLVLRHLIAADAAPLTRLIECSLGGATIYGIVVLVLHADRVRALYGLIRGRVALA